MSEGQGFVLGACACVCEGWWVGVWSNEWWVCACVRACVR